MLIFGKMRVGGYFLLGLAGLWAQGVSIDILVPDSAAILHLESGQRGLLIPQKV